MQGPHILYSYMHLQWKDALFGQPTCEFYIFFSWNWKFSSIMPMLFFLWSLSSSLSCLSDKSNKSQCFWLLSLRQSVIVPPMGPHQYEEMLCATGALNVKNALLVQERGVWNWFNKNAPPCRVVAAPCFQLFMICLFLQAAKGRTSLTSSWNHKNDKW